ncbi:MAG: hypothetical protein WCP85_24535 [Mariniphaga sp.]
MKNKGILIFLLILAVVIVGVIATDFNSTKPDQQPANPYEYNIDSFTRVDTALIMYKETRNLKIELVEPVGIALRENRIFVVGDQKLQIIEPTGRLLQEVNLDQKPTCVYVSEKNIFIGYRQSLSLLNREGVKLADWNSFADSTVITSIAEQSGIVFVADAGKRIVRKFNLEGKPVGEIEGKSGNDQIHGFIIPSPYFDLAFNPSGELWVVNPGKHTLENYTFDGKLRTWWEATSIKIEGFSGCCNPAHFAFLPDGGFVTSEKGLVRIKTYLPSGEFANVVAAPSKFKEEGHAPDLAVDDQGNIFALDLDKRMIRLFVKK